MFKTSCPLATTLLPEEKNFSTIVKCSSIECPLFSSCKSMLAETVTENSVTPFQKMLEIQNFFPVFIW